MYQIVNFKKDGLDKELNTIKVKPLLDREVLVDLPLALIVFGETYEEPILFGQDKGLPIISEKKNVLAFLEEQKKKKENSKEFHLATVNGITKEVKKEKAQWSGMLPKDTDLSEIVITPDGKLEKNVKIEEALE